MGLEHSKGSGDCWGDGDGEQVCLSRDPRDRVAAKVATPRGHPKAHQGVDRPRVSSYMAQASPSRAATAELFSGLPPGMYIPEAMHFSVSDSAGPWTGPKRGTATSFDAAKRPCPEHAAPAPRFSGKPAPAKTTPPLDSRTPVLGGVPSLGARGAPEVPALNLAAIEGFKPHGRQLPADKRPANRMGDAVPESSYTRHDRGGTLSPRSSTGMLTPRSRSVKSSATPETQDPHSGSKGGWIQTTVTISDMNIATWTQQRQDIFIEAVSETAQVPLSDVCVLSLKEKCGRRLLSIATEVTFQVRADSGEHAREIVRDLKSQKLDAIMLQANIRIRPDTARGAEAENQNGPNTPRSFITDIGSSRAGGGFSCNISTPRGNPVTPRGSVASDIGDPLRTPFRNGYSLTTHYQSQFGGEDNAEDKSPRAPTSARDMDDMLPISQRSDNQPAKNVCVKGTADPAREDSHMNRVSIAERVDPATGIMLL